MCISIICQTSLSVFNGGCVQGALGRAGFVWNIRSTNLHTAATFRLVAIRRGPKWSIQTMFKVTPNPTGTSDPKLHQAAQRAMDHYLNPSSKPAPTPSALFSVPSLSFYSFNSPSPRVICLWIMAAHAQLVAISISKIRAVIIGVVVRP